MNLGVTCGRPLQGVALLVMGLATGGAFAQCQAPVWGIGIGVLHSRWQELDEQGVQLVQERGTLANQTLDMALACETLQWQARLQHSQGTRNYVGQTTTGTSANSTSDLDIYAIQLEAIRPVSDTWAWGGRLRATNIRRNINSTAAAQGYPEQFNYWQALLGARMQRPLSAQTRLVIDAWAGGGPSGSMRLQLPIADEANLTLGATRIVQVSAAIEGELGSGAQTPWSWRIALDVGREDMGQGSNSPLLRNGVPFGATRQPHTVQTTAGWQTSVQYRF
ncbi:MAG: hypothetical protein H7Y28_16285 [Rhodoferax sp.]|nr:hypothetical protein [Rhodoferax sp.]